MGNNNFLFGLLVVGAIIFTVAVRLYTRRNPKVALVKRVARTFFIKGKLKGWKILTNLTLKVSDEDEGAICHHAVVAPYGVFIVTDIVSQGKYYGTTYDDDWSCVITTRKKGEEKIKAPNYVKHNTKAIDTFRAILSAEKIYNVNVCGFIVAHKNAKIFVEDCADKIISVSKLGAEIDKIKYEKDNGTDIELLVKLLSRYSNIK